MVKIDAYQQVRGTRLVARAGRRLGPRRRGEILLARARRNDRAAMGVGDEATVTAVTPSLFHRITHHGDGGYGDVLAWTFVTGFVLLVIGFWIGPGIVLGCLIYGIAYALIPRLGPIRIWVMAAIAVVTLIAVLVIHWQLDPHGLKPVIVTRWWLTQAAVAPTWALWLTWAWGWTAVPRTTTGTAASTLVPVDAEQTYEVPTDEPVTSETSTAVPVDEVPLYEVPTDEAEIMAELEAETKAELEAELAFEDFPETAAFPPVTTHIESEN